jgi:hypothetical protein
MNESDQGSVGGGAGGEARSNYRTNVLFVNSICSNQPCDGWIDDEITVKITFLTINQFHVHANPSQGKEEQWGILNSDEQFFCR